MLKANCSQSIQQAGINGSQPYLQKGSRQYKYLKFQNNFSHLYLDSYVVHFVDYEHIPYLHSLY